MTRNNRLLTALLCSSFVFFLSGCAAHEEPKFKKPKDTEVHPIATRQLPLPPTYNPVRWVRPPEVLPSRANPNQPKPVPKVAQIMHFTVKDTTLKETSEILANAMGYRSYCSSLIADRTITLDMLGTLQEVATEIEKNFRIRVVLDHDNKSVRFLANNPVVPQFAESR
jgi:hypothetical protein